MVHRDVKPANVLLDGDEVRVSDLEFCEITGGDGRAARTGSWCTLAPETAPDAGHCSIASDIYSLGATAFYLLSGQYPVDHTLSLAEQQSRIAAGRVREIRALAPHVSRAVGAVVRKAVNPDPRLRFASALDFGNALAHAAGSRRNWQRVLHTGHLHCLEGEERPSKAAVTVCGIATKDAVVSVRARFSVSGRRVSGVVDELARPSQMTKTLQRMVNRLS